MANPKRYADKLRRKEDKPGLQIPEGSFNLQDNFNLIKPLFEPHFTPLLKRGEEEIHAKIEISYSEDIPLEDLTWPELFYKLFDLKNVLGKEQEYAEVDKFIDQKINDNPDRNTFMALQNIVPLNDEQSEIVLSKQRILMTAMQAKTKDVEMGTNPDIEKLLRSVTIFIDPGHGYIPGVGMTKEKETSYTRPMSEEVKRQLEGMVYNPVKFTHSDDPKEAEAENIELDKAMELASQGKHELSGKTRKKKDGTYTFVEEMTQDKLDEILKNSTKKQTVKYWEENTERKMAHLTDRANLYGNYFISIHYNAPASGTAANKAKGQFVFYEKTNANTEESKKLADSIVDSQTVITPDKAVADTYFVTKNFLGIAAVLIEVGFMDNTEEMTLVGGVTGTKFKQCAKEIATGIAKYVNSRKVE